MTTIDQLLAQGIQHHRDGQLAEAVAVLYRAHTLEPTSVEVLFTLGGALASLHRLEDALACFRRVLDLDPRHPAAPTHIGAALRGLGRHDEATPFFEQATETAPDQPENWGNLAIVYKDQSRLEEARACYQRAWEVSRDPLMLLKRTLALPVITRSRDHIREVRQTFLDGVRNFREAGHAIADPLRQVGQTSFLLAYHGLDNRPLHEAVAGMYAQACPSLTWVAPHCQTGAAPAHRQDGRRRLGFISEHFSLHTIGQLNHGLISRLPKERFHITVITPPRPPDRLRNIILKAADTVVEVPPNDLAQARHRIAAEELDLLYYTDLGMRPFTYFLAFARLAPVQTLTWGHPDTTGIPALDYFLSCDAQEPATGADHYSETLARLPGPTLYYPRPAFDGLKSRVELGLPEDATIYVCPQSLFKIHPDFDRVLVEILRRDPRGLLAFVRGGHPHPWHQLHERLARRAPDVAERIVAVPPMSTRDFVALMAASDVMLDPLHYSGGNTSLEALSQGVPIVTWPGVFMRGRHTHGWYRLMGIDDLVARDWEHYIDLAVRLGTDADWRHHLHQRILAANGALFEHADSVTAIADFLEGAVRRTGR
ncbi:MAG TPA: tetratricopeptide repeat protein [Azospirillaceae bacterium]|nr:tetratricopeptide repeat protein [Azospirillaceae bacterium]